MEKTVSIIFFLLSGNQATGKVDKSGLAKWELSSDESDSESASDMESEEQEHDKNITALSGGGPTGELHFYLSSSPQVCHFFLAQ